MSSLYAHPCPAVYDGNGTQIGWQNDGMLLKEYYMAHAPITIQDARNYLIQHGTSKGEPSMPDIIKEMVGMRQVYAEEMILLT